MTNKVLERRIDRSIKEDINASEGEVAHEARKAVDENLTVSLVKLLAQKYYQKVREDTERWGYYDVPLFDNLHPILQEYISRNSAQDENTEARQRDHRYQL